MAAPTPPTPLADYGYDGISIFDPTPREALVKAFKLAIAGQIFCIIMILGCVNILIGSTFYASPWTEKYMWIAVVDGDNGAGVISQALNKVIANQATLQLNYSFVKLDSGSHSFEDLKHLVDMGSYSGAIYLNPGSSNRLMGALTNKTLSATYQASSVFSYAYDEGRVGASYNLSLGGLGTNIAGAAATYVKVGLVSQFASMNMAINNIITPILQSPVAATTTNLHPVAVYGLHVAVGSAMMQLYLVALINTIATAKMLTDFEGRGIKPSHLYYFGLYQRMLSAFVLSVWPVLVVLILGIADLNVIPAPIFFAWWAMMWLGMSTYSGICIWAIRLLGGPVGALFLIIFLMLSVASSTGALPFAAMPDFYRIGYGLPFYNLVQASRGIVIGSNQNELSQNIGIHFAWVGAFILLARWEFFFSPLFKTCCKPKTDGENGEGATEVHRATRYHLFAGRAEVAAVQREERRNSLRMSMTAGQMEGLVGVNGGGMEEGIGAINATAFDAQTGVSVFPRNADDATPITGVGSLGAPTRRTIEDSRDSLNLTDEDDHVLDKVLEGPPLEDIVSAETVSIFDEKMKPLLKMIPRKFIGLEIVMSIFFFVLLLITYGNTINPSQYYGNINVAILNSDAPSPSGAPGVIGGAFANVIKRFAPPYAFTIDYLDATQVTPDQAQQYVQDGKYWAVWTVLPTASSALSSALPSSAGIANPPAINFIYDSGRGGSFVTGLLKLFSARFVGTFNAVVAAGIMQQAAAQKAPFSAYNPLALMSPVTAQPVDLHPLPFAGMDGAIAGSGIALYLGMIVQITILNAAHDPLRELGVRYDHRIIAKILHLFFGAFVLSFWPAISVVWFGVNMSAATFFAYWAFEGIGMAAFGCMTAMNYHFGGQVLGPILNIIMFSLNQASSGASLPFELMPSFFQIGYALPYNQITTGSRYILWGSSVGGQFGRSIGVLLAWIAACTIGGYRLVVRRRRIKQFNQSIKRVFGSKEPSVPGEKNPMMSTTTPSEAAPAPHGSMIAIEGGGVGNLFGGSSAGTGEPPFNVPSSMPVQSHISPDVTNPSNAISSGMAQTKPQPRPLTPEEKKQVTEKTVPGTDNVSTFSGKDSIPEPTPPIHFSHPDIPSSPKQTEPQPPVSATTF